MSNKYRSVEVQTPKGLRLLQFQYGENSGNADEPLNTCERDCVYWKVCKLFPNPTKPEEFNKSRFCDWCTSLGDRAETDDGRELRKMVPVPGTIENELGDLFPRILEVVQEKNPIVYLADVIDSVCEFQCEFYDKEHSQCGNGNALCLLQDLFLKGQKMVEPGQPIMVRTLKTDRSATGRDEKA